MMLNRDDVHALRFLKHKPWGKKLEAIFSNAGDRAVSEALFRQTLDLVLAEGGPAFRSRHIGVSQRDLPSAVMDFIYGDAEISVAVGRWVASGRNVFAFDPQLVDRLSATELGDVRLSELKLPFDNFYLHWGPNTGLQMPGEPNAIEGAYVHRLGGALTVALTSRIHHPPTAHGFDRMMARSRCFFLTLQGDYNDPTLQELLGTFVSRKNEELKGLPPVSEEELKMIADEELRAVFDAAMTNNDLRRSGKDRRLVFLAEGLPTFARAIDLIANLICYLSFVPEASSPQPQWPADTPANYVADLQARRPVVRDLARKELQRRGFSTIRFLPLVEPETGADQPRFDTGREVTPHYRKAHWRRKFDEAGAVIGRSWVRFTIVRADRGSPQHGHIYKVGG